ncbi:MAG TPA: 50S ribosomal protein L11 methyltransferase [Chitinophagaceae bacterium]
MANYIQIEFQHLSSDQIDRLIAALSSIGFEGFEEGENNLKAYIQSTDLNEATLGEIAEKNHLSFERSVIEETNWNAVWESNFQPVIVDDFVAVRADFHETINGVEHEIIITPKMSFGTGHHATTFMMMQQMRKIDFQNKTVFDFGTGTGVLAILAEKLGAKEVLAVDIDDWSIENAKENIDRNGCEHIHIRQANSAIIGRQFDIILGNINRNVILDNLSVLSQQLISTGVVLLSGLLKEDEDDMVNAAMKQSLVLTGKALKNNWLCLQLQH